MYAALQLHVSVYTAVYLCHKPSNLCHKPFNLFHQVVVKAIGGGKQPHTQYGTVSGICYPPQCFFFITEAEIHHCSTTLLVL